ncbi:hypothetical protein [Lacihabitans lacunae]|uniref:Uncharacterized protein n=1 Tax=Lacihabitans lacunae TaxID=1028214 RepID=A0ABV7YQB7_9BACT
MYHYTTTSTTRLNDLAYVFKNRGNVNTTLIKNAFQKLYQARDYAIFDTFWNNAGLSETLFGTILLNESEEDFEKRSKIDFISWVKTFNPKIYSFIDIK